MTTKTTLKFEDCSPGMKVRYQGGESLTVKYVRQTSVIVVDGSGGASAFLLADFDEGNVAAE